MSPRISASMPITAAAAPGTVVMLEIAEKLASERPARSIIFVSHQGEEAGLLGSHVHLDKGCYPGQETVARVHNLGQVQRRLAGLRFQPPASGGRRSLPAPRTDLVTDDGRRAGQLRSVVDHPRLGTIGLAYVRRVVSDGRLVRAGDRVATVVELPFS